MKFINKYSKPKQEQIKQLVTYVNLLGLSGADLTSIGQHLQRLHLSRLADSRINIISNMPVSLVGTDTGSDIYHRFYFDTDHHRYLFTLQDCWGYDYHNIRTFDAYEYEPTQRDWPTHYKWYRRRWYDILLDIHEGKVKLL